MEHGAYNVLLDRYYATEQGIPAGEVYRVARANSAQERKAVDRVLAEFFVLEEEAYRKQRVEKEIERYREKSGKASASAKARWSKSKGNANAPPNAMRTHMPTHSDGNALQSPDSNHQAPEESSLRSLSGAHAQCGADEWRETPGIDSEAMGEWIAHRAIKKPPFGLRPHERLAVSRMLAGMGSPERQRGAVRLAIANGWNHLRPADAQAAMGAEKSKPARTWTPPDDDPEYTRASA